MRSFIKLSVVALVLSTGIAGAAEVDKTSQPATPATSTTKLNTQGQKANPQGLSTATTKGQGLDRREKQQPGFRDARFNAATPPVAGGAPCATAAFLEKTVTRFRQEWRERDVPFTIERVTFRTVVTPVSITELVPICVEEKRCETILKTVPREVIREVECCRRVSVDVYDPCHGCTHIVSKPEHFTRQVKETVFEAVPVQREFVVKVQKFQPVTRTIERKEIVREVHPETVVRKERYSVLVPYQVTVKVPVYAVVLARCCSWCGCW
jgi:hypothetical protein